MDTSPENVASDPVHPAWWLGLDVLAVVVFTVVGMATHESGDGFVTVLWPFVVGLAIAWTVPAVRSLPLLIWPSGVIVWATTTVVGLALRALTGGGVSGAFPWVAAGVLALLLIGWRVVPEVIERRRERRGTA